MSIASIARRLRSAVVNAVTWGAAWGTFAFVTILGLRAVGVVEPEVGVLDALGMGIRVGFAGGFMGLVFAGVVRLLYRGRRLADISALRCGVAGGLLGGIGVPLFIQAMRVLSGDGLIDFDLIRTDTVYSAAFGFLAAAGSMKLAQLAESRSPQLGEGDRPVQLDAGDALDQVPVSRERTPARDR